MIREICGTKAETLAFLYNHADKLSGKVLKPCYFTVREWQESRASILSRLKDELNGCQRLIIRSSARNEDSAIESMAGKYESSICSSLQIKSQ